MSEAGRGIRAACEVHRGLVVPGSPGGWSTVGFPWTHRGGNLLGAGRLQACDHLAPSHTGHRPRSRFGGDPPHGPAVEVKTELSGAVSGRRTASRPRLGTNGKGAVRVPRPGRSTQ